MSLILYAALFVAAVWGILLVVLAGRLGNVRMVKAGAELRDITELPGHLKTLLDAKAPELEALGFEFSHCQSGDEVYAARHSLRWSLVYVNRQDGVYASLAVSRTPDAGNPCSVDFLTLFPDGRRLQTLNGLSHTILGALPNTIINDPYSDTLRKQWESHLKAVPGAARGEAPVILEPSEFVSRESELKRSYIDSLLQRKLIADSGDGAYRLRPWAVLSFAIKILGGMGRSNRLQAARVRLSGKLPAIEIPVEVEVEGFQRSADLEQPRARSWQGELLVFLGSLALFSLSFGILVSPQYLLILLVAISLHEAGHLTGMLLFRYEEVRLLYLPFVGAASIGTPRRVTPFQKVVVSLLGPVPGILIGVFILCIPGISRTAPAVEFAYGMLALNYLNLLPIMPFDGGHVFQNTLFLRFPALQAVFWVASGLLMALLAVVSGSPIFIGIAVFLLLGALPQFRMSKALHLLHHRLQQAPGPDSEETVLRESFRTLREKPFHNLTFQKKYQIVKYLRNNAGGGIPSAGTIVFTVILYGVLFLAPLAVLALRFLGMARHGAIGA